LDCGEGKPDYLPLLETSLKDIQSDAFISDIIISHGHADHWGGLVDILNSKTLNANNQIKIHKYPVPEGKHVDHFEGFPQDVAVEPLKDQQTFSADNTTLRVIYTPGHTPDHCTFFLEEEQRLFTADCILGQGTAVFDDLSEYITGLQRLLEYKPTQLYPGHGPVIEDGTSKIQEYINHRLERENQVVELLTKEETLKEGWSPLEIVQVLYKDYPESLYIPAARGIVLHLLKLQKDGKVSTTKEYALVPENFQHILNAKWVWTTSHKNNL
jgi:glyoxylase-like metal-dependent hydrolase (beta-lactamase superfamily II)